MKNAKIISGIVLMTLCFQACIPSLYPLYKSENLISDQRVEGTWSNEDLETWDFERSILSDEPVYKLRVDEDQFLAAHLLELGDDTFMDFYPLEVKSMFSESDFYGTHFLPVHTFAKVEISESEFTVWFFDTDYILELLEQKRIRIRNEKLDDSFLLSASTEELQKFVLKYADDPKAYLDPITFKKSAQ